jgi:cytochrome b involved in lipid metabolism
MGERMSKPKDNSFSNSIIIKINNDWYDITKYLDIHPGGADILIKYHLRDASDGFNALRSHRFVYNTLNKYKITDKATIEKLNKFDIIN